MLSVIESVNNVVNNFIWGVPAMICIIGVGLYLSIRTNFLQIRKFPYAMKATLGKIFKKSDCVGNARRFDGNARFADYIDLYGDLYNE